MPNARLKARLNAASDSYPTPAAMSATPFGIDVNAWAARRNRHPVVAQTRIAAHLLYGSTEPDWFVYAASAVLILAVGATASLVPARRAASIEPMAVLRQQ
jgi:hypothetical protein